MEKTWRWFGKKDPITLQMLRQIGVEGIVTALHEVKNGDVWTYEAIMDLKNYIEAAGLRWSVVESLPVMESIKYGGPDRDELIEKYKISLANLGKAGVKTICYNFMPVLDWARTDLYHAWADGGSSLYFDKVEFCYFERYILKREGAEKDYTDEENAKADEKSKHMTKEDNDRMVENIIIKTQGFVNGNISEEDFDPVGKFRSLLALYKDIDRDALRENMRYFLAAIMPTCDEWGMNMCVHPDDPPMQLLGLPRIVISNGSSMLSIIHTTDLPSAAVRSLQVLRTISRNLLASMLSALTSFTSVRLMSSQTATSSRQITSLVVLILSRYAASSKSRTQVSQCVSITAAVSLAMRKVRSMQAILSTDVCSPSARWTA